MLTCIEYFLCAWHMRFTCFNLFNPHNYYLYFIGIKIEAQRGIEICLRFQASERQLRDSDPSGMTSCCL